MRSRKMICHSERNKMDRLRTILRNRGTYFSLLLPTFLTVLIVISASAQNGEPSNQNSVNNSIADFDPEQELQIGTALTRQGQFAEGIPHLLAARGHVTNDYAAKFNLALCYLGTNQVKQAIQALTQLRASAHDNADVNNLLAQAYVGDSQDDQAWESLERAANLTPTNEKLYTFVADACMGKQQYALGLRVVDLGLHHLADSPKLHYERGMFLSLLDQFDNAKNDFDLVRKLSPESDIAFMAGAQKAMFEGNISQAIRVAREGIGKGHEDFMLLTLLGEALLRSGIAPGQPEFSEARQALETSIAERPNYAGSQLALGKVYLSEDRVSDAITHFEAARRLSPENPAVYSSLAVVYRKRGDAAQAQAMLAILAKINQAQAEKIRSAPGDRKAGYGGRGSGMTAPPSPE